MTDLLQILLDMRSGQVAADCNAKFSEVLKERFTISIPAFIGGDRVDMDALLRFRVNQGKLTFWYTLVRPEEVIRAAFITARGFIATTLGVTIINGSPE